MVSRVGAHLRGCRAGFWHGLGADPFGARGGDLGCCLAPQGDLLTVQLDRVRDPKRLFQKKNLRSSRAAGSGLSGRHIPENLFRQHSLGRSKLLGQEFMFGPRQVLPLRFSGVMVRRPGPAGVFTAHRGPGHPRRGGKEGRAGPQDHPAARLMPECWGHGKGLCTLRYLPRLPSPLKAEKRREMEILHRNENGMRERRAPRVTGVYLNTHRITQGLSTVSKQKIHRIRY